MCSLKIIFFSPSYQQISFSLLNYYFSFFLQTKKLSFSANVCFVLQRNLVIGTPDKCGATASVGISGISLQAPEQAPA